jgi:hypothetical protein
LHTNYGWRASVVRMADVRSLTYTFQQHFGDAIIDHDIVASGSRHCTDRTTLHRPHDIAQTARHCTDRVQYCTDHVQHNHILYPADVNALTASCAALCFAFLIDVAHSPVYGLLLTITVDLNCSAWPGPLRSHSLKCGFVPRV